MLLIWYVNVENGYVDVIVYLYEVRVVIKESCRYEGKLVWGNNILIT